MQAPTSPGNEGQAVQPLAGAHPPVLPRAQGADDHAHADAGKAQSGEVHGMPQDVTVHVVKVDAAALQVFIVTTAEQDELPLFLNRGIDRTCSSPAAVVSRAVPLTR